MIELAKAIEEVKHYNCSHNHGKKLKKLDHRFYK
jgi:hypothetical protein